MMLDRRDPRLKAAELSEKEFVGNLEEYPNSYPFQLLEAFKESKRWKALAKHPLIEPREGYSLHYAAGAGGEIEVFLLFQCELVGIYCNDTLMIDCKHRSKHLSSELILGAFAQVPWKNKHRKVTRAGKKAFRSAYRFVTDMVRPSGANRPGEK